ncbi:hypothetical protein GCM10009623_23660 [Nocardioides aestuarii]|uniref:Uncharacterized protein n=1 Tax=Nocardioides aestuarii TaxID=252231 RepID=A0ABW4TPW5_9ACTN
MDDERWRPEILWLPTGALLGAMSGALVGVVLLVGVAAVDAAGGGDWSELWIMLVAGSMYGSVAGLVTGVVVGLEMTFLVGRHLPRERARRRARVLGHVLPPLTMLAPFVVASGFDVSGIDGDATWWVVVLAGASLLGGPLARWVAGLATPQPRTTTGPVA